MKFILIPVVFISILAGGYAQDRTFSIYPVKLPPELKEAENQFSGLQLANDQLYLLPECRLQEQHVARLYSIKLSELDQYLKDTSYQYHFSTIPIRGLEKLASRINEQGAEYEGLEAVIIDHRRVYFSVETTTASPFCYLIKRKLKKGNIIMKQALTRVRKPTQPDGTAIYNTGFEAMTMIGNRLRLFFEYNSFDKNYSYSYKRNLSERSKDSILINKIPFRVTDITPSTAGHFTAINFFFKGGGADTVYRVAQAQTKLYQSIHPQNSFTDYCLLLDIYLEKSQYISQPLWILPKQYTGYNWEGITAYNGGYFIINDKYTLAKPYSSVLLYLR